MQKREFAATLAAQALPALHVGTLWEGNRSQTITDTQHIFGKQCTSLLTKLDDKGNEMKENEGTAMKDVSKNPSGNNEDDMLGFKNITTTSDETDMSMMKRCHRKMSRTMSSLHLKVPRSDRKNRHTSFKASLDITTFK